MVKLNIQAQTYDAVTCAPIATPRLAPGTLHLPKDLGNKVMVFGGHKPKTDVFQLIDSVTVYNIDQDHWEPLNQKLHVPRSHATACVTSNFIYIIGGRGVNGSKIGYIEKLPIEGLSDWNIPFSLIKFRTTEIPFSYSAEDVDSILLIGGSQSQVSILNCGTIAHKHL